MTWASARSRRRFAEVLEAGCGLHPREFGTLSVIANEPGVTQHVIGEGAGIDPSTMVAALDELERRGLAERRPHPSDRRKRAVYLTAEGERTLALAAGLARDVGEEFLTRLTPSEREELNRLLRKLTGADD